jgi:imidazolonepropionase-like amidohydrolase
MFKKISVLYLVIISSFLLINCQSDSIQNISSPIAFLDVNIVPMDSERILEHQTVIIRDGKINKIGSLQDIKIPENAIQIEGRGRYLMPGLVDMHAHVEHEDALILFLANGVTTVRNMWGFSKHLTWKKKIIDGELKGPSIYTAGSLFDGSPGIWDGSIVLEKPEEAEQFVIDQKEKGYDFIKVYYLQKEPFNALLAAARKHNIPVIGHVSDAVGLEGILTSGQYSIEHLDGYWMSLESDNSPFRDKFDYHSYIMKWNYIDETKMPAAAALTKSSSIWNCPTLIVYQRNASPAEADSFYALPEMKYMDPVSLASWDPTKYFATKDLTDEEWKAEGKMFSILMKFTGHLHKAGAKLLLGSDTPNPFVVPGFSIHRELQNFIETGMSPYEAIKTGTYNAAECLGELDKFGTIQIGKQADLILLKDNPLEDVANITRRCGVMVRGQWFSEDVLQDMLKKIASSYSPPENRFAEILPIKSKNEFIQKRNYELTYNGVPFGEERYALFVNNDGSYELISQTVTDRPYATKTHVNMILDHTYCCTEIEYENKTSTDKNLVRFTRSNDSLKIAFTLEENEKMHKNSAISKETILSPPKTSVCVSSVPVLASYLQFIHKLKSLSIGDSIVVVNKSLQLNFPNKIIEESIKIQRLNDSEGQFSDVFIPVRVYKFITSSPNVLIKSVLSMDQKGHLVSLEIEQQIGILRFNLVNID